MCSDEGVGALPVVRQGELISEIGGILVEEYGTEWDKMWLESRTLGPESEDDVYIERAASDTVNCSVPMRAGGLLGELRDVMATPEGGAWYSMTLTITPDMRVVARFDYENEPEWSGFGPAYNSFVRELERFPRSEEKLPAWFRPRMEEARLKALEYEAILAEDD
ncbi:hypothetical protein IU449_10455 [Nocardia higoensis]|uniref:Polyketide cyclase / dehydrase and lipid transport n=1 Tax=Nocardia higoensis TaxID=228599 RepID=A0ABS0D914_9NOCA|nr:hypothetical protein [Nocardia higoensis]MBF6354960.1 hypothetical protein [Nocardia higoensis]